jgi:hypothetical protein
MLARSRERGSVDPVVVLAGCLGCRSRRAALGPGCFMLRGLAGRLSLRGGSAGEEALEPDRSGHGHEHACSETGRHPVIPCVVRASAGRPEEGLSSMEGVLIRRNRRPLTRRRRRRIERPRVTGIQSRDGIHPGPWQRTSEASSHARSVAENARIGRLGVEELPIAAPPGLRWVWWAWASGAPTPDVPKGDPRQRVAAEAEAGGSPSSGAPPGWFVRQAASRSQPRHRQAFGQGRAGVLEREAHVARRGRRAREHEAGNRTVRGVLVR